jgi:uncharacterized protein
LENPFMYGKPVKGDFYLDLPHLKKELQSFVDSKINVLVMGPRRTGKTSFLKSFLDDQRARKKIVLDIDVFNVLSHKDFLNQFINSINKEKKSTQRFFDWLRNVKSLSPVFKWEANPHSGEIEYALNFSRLEESDTKQAILSTLSGLKELTDKGELLISIDEFQRIGELDDKGWLEATLRSTMQEHPKIAFIFTGSRRSLLSDMFNNSRRPFYKSCKQINFPVFGSEFSKWVLQRFRKSGITSSLETIDYLCKTVERMPSFVQETCFHLASSGLKDISAKDVDNALIVVSTQGSYVYESLLNTMTPVQIKFLRLILGEGKIDYSKEVLQRYELKGASTVQSAARTLLEKQIVFKEANGDIVFEDAMFKIWLKGKFP